MNKKRLKDEMPVCTQIRAVNPETLHSMGAVTRYAHNANAVFDWLKMELPTSDVPHNVSFHYTTIQQTNINQDVRIVHTWLEEDFHLNWTPAYKWIFLIIVLFVFLPDILRFFGIIHY